MGMGGIVSSMSTRPLTVTIPLADLAILLEKAPLDNLQRSCLDLAKRDFAGAKPERATLIVGKIYRQVVGNDASEGTIISILRELCNL